MVQTNLIGIFFVFIFHAVTMFVLCPSRFTRNKTVAIWCGMILADAVACFAVMQLLPNFTGLLIGFSIALVSFSVIVFYLSDKSFAKTLFLFLAYLQGFMATVFLSGFLSYHLFEKNLVATIILRTIMQIVIVILCIFFQGKFNALSRDIVKGWWPLDLLALLLLSYLSILSLYAYSDYSKKTGNIFVFLLIAVLLGVYWIFFYTIGFMHRAAKAHQSELKSELLQQRIEAMQDAIEETARVRHDARHHNRQIGEYVRKGETQALLRYLDEQEQTANERQPKQICENPTADTILAVYARKAEQSGILVHFDVVLKKDLAIGDVDLVTILANLFENAIHGCTASGKQGQSIEVQIRRKINKLVIKICNTCADNVKITDGLPRSKSGEGVGISSVLHSVKSYNGDIDFKTEHGVFICRILLPYLTKN